MILDSNDSENCVLLNNVLCDIQDAMPREIAYPANQAAKYLQNTGTVALCDEGKSAPTHIPAASH